MTGRVNEVEQVVLSLVIEHKGGCLCLHNTSSLRSEADRRKYTHEQHAEQGEDTIQCLRLSSPSFISS